jgi:hypothetical protein
MNIVLADDRPDAAILAALAERGCPVKHVTATADEALWKCWNEPVDAVVSTAVFLTGMNCVQLADALSALRPAPRLVVISPFPKRVLRMISGFPPRGVPVFSTSEVEAIVRAVVGCGACRGASADG